MYRIGKGSSISSPAFQRLVQGLKDRKKTIAVVESSCGGLIQASIMAVPGSSQVYFGGSIAYNTKRSLPLLLNDKVLQERISQPPLMNHDATPTDAYIRSKEQWTAETAKAFCDALEVDYAIAEGGASGPTFRPDGMNTGFAVIAIAGRTAGGGPAQIVAQQTISSSHAKREANMRLFADGAATLAADSIGLPKNIQEQRPSSASPHTQEHSHLDRATHLRSDQVALDRMEQSVDARFVILHKKSTECLFQSSNSHLALLAKSELPTNVNTESTSFLGLDPTTRAPLFSVDLSDDDSGPTGSINLPLGMTFGNIRTHAPLMPSYDYELVLYATALSNWKRTHKFCSICASPLVPIQGGTCLQCTSPTCGNLSWPRQDPSIIVLVTNRDGDKALLAHSPRHPPKVHTALAGFVEAGETFEQAVIREVMEETGTRVKYDSIQYVSSQPWPFPRSCMIGFVAHAMDDTTPLVIDRNELVSAGWFDREQVRAASKIPGAVMNHDIAMTALEENPSLDLLIPPTGVLARSLIDHWLENPVEI